MFVTYILLLDRYHVLLIIYDALITKLLNVVITYQATKMILIKHVSLFWVLRFYCVTRQCFRKTAIIKSKQLLYIT